MKFLSDAHISVEMVQMTLGHDCTDASSIPPRMEYVDVLRKAADEERAIITADKDSGELVFLHRLQVPGVLLIRVTFADETSRVQRVRSVWPAVIARLPGS